MVRFYAVQVGDNNDWDYGSTVKRKAIAIAHREMKNHNNDGKEVRIALINIKNRFCDEEIVLRDGERE